MPGRRRRLRLLLLLGTLLLLLLLLLGFSLDGASGFPVPNPLQHQVDGTVGGSILLTALTPPEKAVDQIEWDFQPQNGSVRVIAEFTRGNFERPNPSDRFQQRLEKANETTLRIKDLVKEDGGVYTAHVRFKGAEAEDQRFVLVVAPWTPSSPTRPPLLLTVKSELGERWKFILIVPFIALVSYGVIWLLNEMKPLFRKGRKCLSLS